MTPSCLVSDRRTPLAWVRLNADGVLLSLLALAAGLDLFHPQAEDLARALGFVPPTFYLWTAGYVTGGLLMLVGFFKRRIGPELAGRLVLCLSVGLETARTGAILGWASSTMADRYVTVGIVVALCAVRATALLSKDGLVVFVGGSGPDGLIEDDHADPADEAGGATDANEDER